MAGDLKNRDHELHTRRKGRNLMLGGILVSFVALVFVITIVKLSQGQMIEGFDHAVRPSLLEKAE